jgi:hypothetical protein
MCIEKLRKTEESAERSSASQFLIIAVRGIWEWTTTAAPVAQLAALLSAQFAEHLSARLSAQRAAKLFAV